MARKSVHSLRDRPNHCKRRRPYRHCPTQSRLFAWLHTTRPHPDRMRLPRLARWSPDPPQRFIPSSSSSCALANLKFCSLCANQMFGFISAPAVWWVHYVHNCNEWHVFETCIAYAIICSDIYIASQIDDLLVWLNWRINLFVKNAKTRQRADNLNTGEMLEMQCESSRNVIS